MDPATRVQVLDEAACISKSANTLGKRVNTSIPSPARGNYKGRLDSLILVCQPDKEKENFEFKPVELHLRTDLVSHLARVEGMVNTYTHVYTYTYTHTHIYIEKYI